MDPRDRADAALARARARDAFVVTPDDAVSPMDATNTQQIPRAVVSALDTDRQDGDTTMVITSGLARGQAQQGQPQQGQGPQPAQPQQQTQPLAVQQLPAQQGPGQQRSAPQRPAQQRPAQPYPDRQDTQQPISPALLEATPTQPVQIQVPAQQQQQQDYRPATEPEPEPVPRELDGLVPTVQQPANRRSTLSRRLEGD
jgi:hypothetical protein